MIRLAKPRHMTVEVFGPITRDNRDDCRQWITWSTDAPYFDDSPIAFYIYSPESMRDHDVLWGDMIVRYANGRYEQMKPHEVLEQFEYVNG